MALLIMLLENGARDMECLQRLKIINRSFDYKRPKYRPLMEVEDIWHLKCQAEERLGSSPRWATT